MQQQQELTGEQVRQWLEAITGAVLAMDSVNITTSDPDALAAAQSKMDLLRAVSADPRQDYVVDNEGNLIVDNDGNPITAG